MKEFDPNDDSYLEELDRIAHEDVAGLITSQLSYGNSWKNRGGIGAFMMLARKWDRLEKRVQKEVGNSDSPGTPAARYDIFAHIISDIRSEGIIDDIRDLRRYLLLVEAEMAARGTQAACSEHRDR